MSGLLNSSLNSSASNLPDSNGRSFASSFSGQSGAGSPVFHHTGTIQGLHNIHGSFNVPNMPGTLASRNSTISNVPSGGVQQPTGSLSSGRFASNNIPVALSQLSHGSSHGHSGLTNRGGINVVGNPGFSSNTNGVGGSIPGILPTSAGIGNRNAVQGLGVSPILGNAGPRITSSMGNMVGGGNIGRSMSSGGGLSVPGLATRLNLTANSGSGNLSVQGQNRLMSGVLPQGSPQVISMLGNSYPSAGPLSQSHVQAVNSLSSMGMLNDVNSNDSSPFDINNDFPQLTSRPSSAGGPQGQMGSLRKQGIGVSPIVQQNQEFSIQNEDFPALPGFKGGNADYTMDMHQKEQLHDNTMSMIQSQHFPMSRSAGFNLGGSYSSYRPQQQQQQHAPAVSSSGVTFSSVSNQDLLHGSDIFPSSHSTYHSQNHGPPGIGLRPLNSPNTVSGMGSYDQLIQQYHQHQNQSQFRLQQISAVNQPFRDQTMKSMQAAQSAPDPFGLLGLLSVIRMSDPDLTSLALGIDLTTLGLNLNSTENLHKTFGSPWSDEPAKGDPDFSVPQCYYAKQPPVLHQGYFSKFTVETLFYIFYSMPKDEAQMGIKESSLAQAIVTTVNICGMLFIIIVGGYLAFKTGWVGYELPSGYFPLGLNGMLGGSAVVFFSFIGFDVVASTAEEVKNPQRDLPLGIGIALSICCILYMLVSVVIVGLVPYFALDPDTPISSAFASHGMQWAVYIITTGAVTALCASLMGSLLPQPRMFMAMARDGLLPSFFSDINEQTQVPVKSTIAIGFLAAALAFFMDVSQLAGMVSVGTLLAFTAVAVSVLILRYVPPDEVPLASSLHESVDSASLQYSGGDIQGVASQNFKGSPNYSATSQCLLDKAGTSTKHPLLQKHKAQNEPNQLKRRKIAAWSITIICIGVLVLTYAASYEFLPSLLRFTLCAAGGALVLCSLIVLACIAQDNARHSFGHTGGFICPFVPFLPVACILVNTYLLVNLGSGTWIRVSIWLLAGELVYLFYGRTHSSLTNAVYVSTAYADEIYRTSSSRLV